MEMDLNPKFEELERLLRKYSGLDYILLGGVVGVKLCRTILDLDKWEMEDLKQALLMALCIKGLSNSTFRAVPKVVAYIQERAASVDSTSALAPVADERGSAQ